jgi:hypothetical protein
MVNPRIIGSNPEMCTSVNCTEFVNKLENDCGFRMKLDAILYSVATTSTVNNRSDHIILELLYFHDVSIVSSPVLVSVINVYGARPSNFATDCRGLKAPCMPQLPCMSLNIS